MLDGREVGVAAETTQHEGNGKSVNSGSKRTGGKGRKPIHVGGPLNQVGGAGCPLESISKPRLSTGSDFFKFLIGSHAVII